MLHANQQITGEIKGNIPKTPCFMPMVTTNIENKISKISFSL
jgi:hypothetical protein